MDNKVAWNTGGLDCSALPNDLPKNEKSEHFVVETVKCKMLSNLMDKMVGKHG